MRSNINDLADDKGNVFWWRVFTFGVAIFVLFAGLAVVSSFLGWGIGWSTLPAQKYSVENVQREYEVFYTMHQQIRTNRQIVANLEAKKAAIREANGSDSSRWPSSVRDEYSQTNQQILQMQTAFSAACGQYEARWANVFHSMAAPSDIPRSCDAIE